MSRNSSTTRGKSSPFLHTHAGQTIGNLIRTSSPKKLDARVRHTRDALGDALIALMHEKPFESITVQHVLDRANVGRSTFYNHFRDKNDLFLSDVDDFFALISGALDRRRDKSNRLAPVHEFFAHVADVPVFIRAMNDAQKLHDVFELGKAHFARGIEARLASMPATKSMNPVSRAARAHSLAGSLISLLDWWLPRQKAATPQQMDDLFHQLAWSGLQPKLQQSSVPGKT